MSGSHAGGRIEAALQLSGVAQNRAVLDSWQRCHDQFGLVHETARRPEIISESQTRQRRDRSGRLFHHAHEMVRTLYRKIDTAGYAVFLTDRDGVILDSVAAHSMLPSFRTNGLLPGAIWSEEREGTNGIGTCLVEGRPITIHKDEHFLTQHAGLTCTAAPVFDPDGKVCSVLDVSAVRNDIRREDCLRVRSLVADYADALERILFFDECANDIIVHLHPDAEHVGTARDALIAVRPDGAITGSTALARRLLSALGGAQNIQSLLGADLDSLMARMMPVNPVATSNTGTQAVPIGGGGVMFGQLTLPEKQRRRFYTAKPQPAKHPANDSHDIPDQDGVLRRLFQMGSKLLANDIHLLMSGETGSGKEHLARAIHNSAMGAGKPFVAINCAALPESLIESELFGHASGAFTGAARDGFGGRIKQADGGTLFLDEIGDMPVGIQGRLLRVLEQRCVEPLGSTKSVPVNFRLICASNVDLAHAVANGKFREDLLYRIKGARLALPPLRERADMADLVARLLAGFARNGPVRCDDSVMDLLQRHNWPGNVRELVNVLQYACVFAENGVIKVSHLPDDLQGLIKTADAPAPKQTNGHNPLWQAERDALGQALNDQCWHVSKTAKMLGISRNTLYRKMEKYGIERTGRNGIAWF
ncbi:sigma-54-dependent Fis family transcriptional regulator [Thalassospira sp. MCCC 1A01428]|uniref:sigma-54-dependent Fis family transcriptional regulator n=1 Tax=Thalassospira sp. MCCC 1A01428 TaxID=1470575 RepID=UPI000A1E5BB2|nr:sigma-54-dependent Fis family transcriptional regulator [Thalassospira sp. MCCC 1A01428]OSQ44849.1 Fis family transcriptional regulator [Thalassospira sp. MCCC 1A01428]